MSEQLDIPGFKWFGQNRPLRHIRAKCGSGGVGFLVRNEILNDFDVRILDDSIEGILWLSFKNKLDESMFLSCVCYLVPVNSSYNVNANEFFNNLLIQVSQYQDIAEFYICGDFNARCGDMADFIEGVDQLPERQITDLTLNAYSDLFIDFLINVNCCIVNDRNSIVNDYTFVSTRGCSDVDYCLTAYGTLSRISNFKVVRASQLVHDANILGQVDTSHAIPDHSILQWSFSLNCKSQASAHTVPGYERIKYNTSSIPQTFMLGNFVKDHFFDTVTNLESSV